MIFDEKEYREVFSRVTASDETFRRVMQMKNKKKEHYVGRMSRMVLIAAVLVSMMAISVFAYTGYYVFDNPGDMMEAFFGKNGYEHVPSETVTEDFGEWGTKEWITPEQDREPLNEALAEEFVEPHVFAVGQSISSDGYTMTLEAFSYSPSTKTGLVYYTVENPEGVSGYNVQPNGELWWSGVELIYCNQGYKNYIVKDQTSDTKLVVASYIYRFEEDEGLYMNFYSEVDWDQDGNTIESNMGITLSLDNETEGMKSISLADGNIVISPIGISVYGKDIGLMNDGNETIVHSLSIHYADGTEYNIKADGVQNYAFGTTVLQPVSFTTYCLNRIVNVDQVDTVVIDGTEYIVQ